MVCTVLNTPGTFVGGVITNVLLTLLSQGAGSNMAVFISRELKILLQQVGERGSTSTAEETIAAEAIGWRQPCWT
jgi:hypothetical protein